MQRFVFGVLLMVSISVWETTSYPHMAPSLACWTMRPNHGCSPQSSQAPYQLTVPANYEPGKEYEITLRSSSGRTFRGFIIEARSGSNTVGTFRVTNPRSRVHCDNGALTHNSPQTKSEIKGTWKAPNRASGNIVFKATVVATYCSYWADITSAQVTPLS